MKKRNLYLLLFILLASLALIGINYFTIKIQSAVRAYINGESEYSKGQKDAALYLYSYIATEDSAYMKPFDESIWVPMADNFARNSMLSNFDDSITTRYFLMGRNHPDDVPGLIWLFKAFRNTYMKTPVALWTDAEPQINELYNIGIQINIKIKKGALTAEERLTAVRDISKITAELYKKESTFSKVLGETARKVNLLLLLANIACILLILGSISLYVAVMIRRLNASFQIMKAKNSEIVDAKKEVDTLVYSLSHDLRSPITSIQGLIRIAREEDDPEKLKEYIEDISNTIDRQDVFVKEIISFFRQKRASVSNSTFSLKHIIDGILASNKFSNEGHRIDIRQELQVDAMRTDELRAKMILSNLISNAIKYSDCKKPEKKILIKAYEERKKIVIEIEDNGVGIESQFVEKIFNIFFVTSHANKGTGLGLYIVKQNVEKLGGTIAVASEHGVGTKFTVTLPNLEK